MSRARAYISMEKKLASALLCLRDESGALYIPYDHGKLMTADQVISLFQFDHGEFHTFDGSDEPYNLTPRNIIDARKKTAKIDVPAIAKVANIATTQAIHKAAMASKAGDYRGAAQILATAPKPGRLKPRRKIASRPFQKGHRPLRSRSSFERRAAT